MPNSINLILKLLKYTRVIMLSFLCFLFIQFFFLRSTYALVFFLPLLAMYLIILLFRQFPSSALGSVLLHFLLLPFLFLFFKLGFPLFVLGEYLLFWIIYIINSLYSYVRSDNNEPILPWKDLLICIIVTIFASYFHANYLIILSYFSVILFLLLYFCQLFFHGIWKFYETNAHTESTAYEKIYQLRLSSFGSLLFLFFLFTLVINCLPYAAIKNIILLQLQPFIKTVSFIMTIIVYLLDHINFTYSQDPSLLQSSSWNTKKWNIVMENDYLFPIFQTGMIILLSILFLYFIFTVLRTLLKLRHKKTSHNFEVCHIAKHEKKERLPFSHSSPSTVDKNEKIVRRLYRKKVSSFMKQCPVNNSMTTGQITESVKNASYDLSRFSSLYDECRYGNKPITKETVDQALDLYNDLPDNNITSSDDMP